MSKKPGLTVDEQEKVKMLVAMGKTYHAIAKEIGRDEKTVKKMRDDNGRLFRDCCKET